PRNDGDRRSRGDDRERPSNRRRRRAGGIAAVDDRVAAPPALPRMLFDGDCGFCRFWVERWRGRLAGRVEFAPYRDRGGGLPGRPDGEFASAVHLILPDGSVFRGARAVFRALALRPGGGAGLRAYRSLPPFAAASEGVYAWIAAHRGFAVR